MGEDVYYPKKGAWSKRKWCCCCCSVSVTILLVFAVIIVILFLTVLKTRNPTLHVDAIVLQDLSIGVDTRLRPTVSVGLGIRVSVHNPNHASFKYTNSTAYLYYHGESVGQAPIPAGKIRALKTTQIATSVSVKLTNIVGNQNITSDLNSGILPLTNTAQVRGSVDVLGIVKLKHAVASTDCTISIFVLNATLRDFSCRYKVKVT